MESGLHLTDS